MQTIQIFEQDKKEIIEQINEIKEYVDSMIHPIVSPDDYWIYSNLRDLIDQLQIILKQKNVV